MVPMCGSSRAVGDHNLHCQKNRWLLEEEHCNSRYSTIQLYNAITCYKYEQTWQNIVYISTLLLEQTWTLMNRVSSTRVIDQFVQGDARIVMFGEDRCIKVIGRPNQVRSLIMIVAPHTEVPDFFFCFGTGIEIGNERLMPIITGHR